MTFAWLKRYMPRGLYGRAALILIMPIVTLQLVVSVVFIQRHYEGVTRQMTRSLVLELELLHDEINTADSLIEATARLARLSEPLKLDVSLMGVEPRHRDSRWFYDLSGRSLIETLRAETSSVQAVDLKSDTRRVRIWMDTRYGVVQMTLHRDRLSASNPHQFLVLMVFVGGLMTLVAFIYLRNQLRPIKRLARAAEAFGRGQVVEYRPSGANEVRSAGNAFLDMRSRIDRQIEQRTMMLSSVSHDLRTPLTRFKLGLSMLEQTADIAELERDISEMERLLDGFLAFARGDASEDPVETDLMAGVRDFVQRCIKNGEPVELGQMKGEGKVMLRPMALERILDNLVSNALRYGNRAVVAVELTPKAARISVSDDGPGIPKDLREEALKPFARLDQARNQNRGGGVGLGLAISNDIARRHGGSLRLGRNSELGGLQVDVVLPR